MADDSLSPPENRSGIYEIVNTVNGKRYVGSAVNIALRWRQHRCELGKGRHNPHLQSAWLKHGAEAFKFRVLELVSDTADLLKREQHYLDTLKPEYNCAPIAGSNLGVSFGKKTREKISEVHRKLWATADYREKMKARPVAIPTAETKAKISAAHKGRKLPPDRAEAFAKLATERNRTPEHRAKLSAFWKGRAKTAEQTAKMAATKRGRPLSPEHRAKLAETMRLAHAEGRHRREQTVDLRHRIGRSVAKLTDDQVLDILLRWRRGATQRSLCSEYGISNAAMSNICNRKTYTWVVPEG